MSPDWFYSTPQMNSTTVVLKCLISSQTSWCPACVTGIPSIKIQHTAARMLLHNTQVFSFSAYWLRSKCWVCCQHIYLWSWMRALFWYPFHR